MKNIAVLSILLVLSACGMRPVYGINRDTPVGVETRLDQVYINNIPDREGQYLRNALIDRFYRDGRPEDARYTLTILPIVESLSDLDITKSSDSTRGQLRLDSGLVMIDRATDKRVLQRRLTSITSYNILGSEFATRVTRDNARTNALDDLARQTEMQIGLYFKRLDSGTVSEDEGEDIDKPTQRFHIQGGAHENAQGNAAENVPARLQPEALQHGHNPDMPQ